MRVLVAGLLFGVACSSGPSLVERKAVAVESLATDAALRNYRSFRDASSVLGSASESLCADPSPAALEVARTAWWDAQTPWKQAEIVRFGPIVEYPERLGPKLDDWPANEADVEALIASEEAVDAASFADRGTSTRGLPVVEYLLWGPAPADSLAALVSEPRRCDVLVGASADVAVSARGLVDAWEGRWLALVGTPSLADDGPYDFPQDALDEWVNRMGFTTENIRLEKLGTPLGDKAGGALQPDTIEARYSGRSLTTMRDALSGVDRVWRGAPGVDGSGVRSLIDDDELVGRVDSELAGADAALQAIPEVFETALTEDPESAKAAQEALQALQVSIQVDVSQWLGVTVAFNDNDGD